MKQYIIKFLIVILLAGGYSCKKDHFKLDNPNALSKETFWNNLDDINIGMVAVYNAMLNHYILNLDKEAARSDQGWTGYGRPQPGGDLLSWYIMTYSATDVHITNHWTSCYKVIFRANQVIEGLQNIETDMETEEDQQLWRYYMGEARFFRGLMHFFLHSAFNNGDIIIRDFVPEMLDDFSQDVSPSAEVIEFFREDLSYAYHNLPPMWTNDAVRGRATAGAASTALGLSFLYEATEGSGPNNMALIDSASAYFTDVIFNESYGYQLATGNDIYELFTIDGEFGPESIFEICYNLEFEPEASQWDGEENSMHNRWAKMMTGSEGPLLPAWMAYALKGEPMDPKVTANYYYNEAQDTTLMRNVSLRCSQYATVVEDEQTIFVGRGDGLGSVFESEIYGQWGFGRSYKYGFLHEPALDNDWKSNKNVVLYRLSGVYLLLAECAIYQGDIEGALWLINSIRARWGLELLGPDNGDQTRTYDGYSYATNPDSLMNRLMYIESPLEMHHEGHMSRWINMRRWGITALRFNQLANETYYSVAYTGTRASDGTEHTVGNSSVIRTDEEGATEINYEYDLKSANYNPDLHDWYDIPMLESSTNTAVD